MSTICVHTSSACSGQRWACAPELTQLGVLQDAGKRQCPLDAQLVPGEVERDHTMRHDRGAQRRHVHRAKHLRLERLTPPPYPKAARGLSPRPHPSHTCRWPCARIIVASISATALILSGLVNWPLLGIFVMSCIVTFGYWWSLPSLEIEKRGTTSLVMWSASLPAPRMTCPSLTGGSMSAHKEKTKFSARHLRGDTGAGAVYGHGPREGVR